ncbi:hypothetical protein [Spirillospora sp. NPDC029432]|uniref:hypothetical protein n=1 Tax=Spirillospora sp. NPDC029432 TaxID=3154599 RepID=UPI0034526DDF
MTKRPMTVNAAAALEAAEGVTAIGFGLFVGFETLIGEAVDPATAIGVTVLALAGGAGMLACARGLLRAEPWSRAPTVLTQLFALPVAWSLWQSEQPLVAVPLGLAAVVTLVLALSPPSTGWLVERPEHDTADTADTDGSAETGGTGGPDAVDEDPATDAVPDTAAQPGRDGTGKRPT